MKKPIIIDTKIDQAKNTLLKLEAIVEESHDAIIGKTLEGIIVSWNGGATKMFGYSKEEMIGKSLSVLFINERKNELLSLLEKVRKGETITDYDSIWIKKDGTSVDVEFSISPIHAEKGLIVGTSLVGRDISEEKKHLENLKFQNVILHTQQEVSMDGILVVDENGKIISSNKKFSDIWGIPPDIMESKSDEKALKFVKDKMVDFEEFITKVKYLYTNRNETSRDEIILKDGRVFDRYSAPILSGNKKYYGRVWFFRDITEHKEEEKKLKASEERFYFSFEYAVNGACFVGVDGKFIRTNIAFKKIMGYTEEEILKLKFNDITYPDDISIGANFLKSLLNGEIENASFEKRYIRKDGNIIWVSIYTSLIKINSKPAYFVTQTVDITEHKMVEEKLKGSEDKYRTLIETSPDCIKVFDLKGKLLFINEGGRKEHNLKSPEEIENFNALETIIEEDRYKFTKALQDAGEGKSSIIEIRHTKEGADRDVCLETLSPIKNDKGDITGAFAISRDLTELRRSETEFKIKYNDMEGVYKLTIDRELKMIELKKEIKNLNLEISGLKAKL